MYIVVLDLEKFVNCVYVCVFINSGIYNVLLVNMKRATFRVKLQNL